MFHHPGVPRWFYRVSGTQARITVELWRRRQAVGDGVQAHASEGERLRLCPLVQWFLGAAVHCPDQGDVVRLGQRMEMQPRAMGREQEGQ